MISIMIKTDLCVSFNTVGRLNYWFRAAPLPRFSQFF